MNDEKKDMTVKEIDVIGEAERVVEKLERNNRGAIALTTSQLRKFLAAVNSLTNKIKVYKIQSENPEVLSDELAAEVRYLQVKLVYQIGRETGRELPIKDFENKAQLLDKIKRIGKNTKKYEQFAIYIEALVAYRKFKGGDK
jgi:CRISPR-associated protein Csm2